VIPVPRDPWAAARDYEARADRAGRRAQGRYYTPRELVAAVLDLVPAGDAPRDVLDPACGAGAFLLGAQARWPAARLQGVDLDGGALALARESLPGADLLRGDALRGAGPRDVDLVVGNPPYGIAPGHSVDRYAAFMEEALARARPGGRVALLVPDTWLTNTRAAAFRAGLCERAVLEAVRDLGKPFAGAKDTRVCAVVLRRKPAPDADARVFAGPALLNRVPQRTFAAQAREGFFVYLTPAQAAACARMRDAHRPFGDEWQVGYGLRTGNNARHVLRGTGRGAPLVGGEDVQRWGLRWREKHLRADRVARIAEAARSQRAMARIAVQRIRTNSTDPDARWLEAAPVPRDAVCLDSLSWIAGADLPRALAALNARLLNRYYRLHWTDVNVKPAFLRLLPAPPPDAPLAELARARLRAGAAGRASDRARGDAARLDDAIDARLRKLYGLRPGDLD
jgi:predicted RNA methylase